MIQTREEILITVADRQRLGSLIDEASRLGLVEPRFLDELEHELERAACVAPEDVPDDVITMNSKVRLRDLDTDELLEYTLAYPRNGMAPEGAVSILAPLGIALIGYRIGQTLELPVPAGSLRVRVEDLVYQPESAGNFSR